MLRYLQIQSMYGLEFKVGSNDIYGYCSYTVLTYKFFFYYRTNKNYYDRWLANFNFKCDAMCGIFNGITIHKKENFHSSFIGENHKMIEKKFFETGTINSKQVFYHFRLCSHHRLRKFTDWTFFKYAFTTIYFGFPHNRIKYPLKIFTLTRVLGEERECSIIWLYLELCEWKLKHI